MITMVIGEFEEHTREAMTAASQRAGAQCLFVSETARALSLISSLDAPPRCIFVSTKADLGTLADRLRDSMEYYTIPLIGLVPFPCGDSFLLATRLGADDCIPVFDTGGMTRRLANVLEGSAPRIPEIDAGKAIVAVSDDRRRRHVGRRLRSAGYNVEFVAQAQELKAKDDDQAPPALLVTTPSFMPTKPPAAKKSTGDEPTTQIARVTVPRSTGDPIAPRELTDPEVVERLMFLVDEATRPAAHDARRSRRIQNATISTFRTVRSFEHSYALTDNISRQGLYLRTLDPPPQGIDVRINLRDKYGDVLQIRGKVAWRYAPNSVGGRTCPGFGVSIDEASCPVEDLMKYHAFYDQALKEVEAAERAPGGQLPAPEGDPQDAPSGVHRTISSRPQTSPELGSG